jgi:hypothetical protein
MHVLGRKCFDGVRCENTYQISFRVELGTESAQALGKFHRIKYG